jgi:predicted S18 family serine protease
MKLARVLAILLVLSLCANAYFILLTPAGQASLREATTRINELEAENARLTMELDRFNLTLTGYQDQLEIFRQRIQELTGLMNATPGTHQGIAVLQAPAVTQRIEYSRDTPFLRGRVTEEGAMINITAEVKPGKGRVLVDTQPLMGLVFQDAAKAAVLVAGNRTGTSLEGSDVIFSITAPAEVPAVDGPSAGALMTLLVISVLEGKPLREDVTLTGTIDRQGGIGAIGGIVEKAQAAKDAGKALFLLPRANANLVRYEEETREYYGFTVVRQVPRTVDAREYVQTSVGIQVRYVDTIDDALELATGAG